MIFSLYPSFIQALRHCEICFNEPWLVNLRAAVSKFCTVMAYLSCFPRKLAASTLVTLRTYMVGPYLCHGLTRESKLLIILVLLSLNSLEICAGKTLPEENFSNWRSSSS